MKMCVSSYSFGEYIKPEKLGCQGIIDKAAELGFDAVEFTDGEWSCGLSADVAAKLKKRAADAGISIAAYCVGADFINGRAGNASAEAERLKAHVDFAAELGVKMMRHDITGGFTGQKYSRGYDDALSAVADSVRSLSVYAQQRGVKTMTENHGYFSQDAARVEKLINTVAHPNFGALVDIGNFMCVDENPNVSIGIMAPYAFHVHAKDFHYKSGMEPFPGEGWFRTRAGNYLRGAVIGHGDARVAQSLRVLATSGYDGYVSVEFEGIEDKLLGIRLGLAALRAYTEKL